MNVRQRSWPLSPMVLLLMGLGAACGTVPDAAEEPAPAAVHVDPAAAIRVLVYNIHAGTRASGEGNLPEVAELVRNTGADVVLLQEVDRETERSGRVDQLAVLEGRTGFHGVFGRTLRYQGGGYGIAVLSRWPIASHALQPLRVDPPQERAGGSYEPRGALWIRMSAPGRGLGVVNTHLDASSRDTYRRQEVASVLATADRLRTEVPWTVVGGDFNAEPGTATIESMRAAGWTDAWEACGDGTGFTFPSEAPVKRIDYLFLASGLTCTSAEVLQTRRSDHLPLLVVVVKAP